MIIAVVYILGVFLKRTKIIEDSFISFILLVLAIGFTLLTNDISTRQKVAEAAMKGVVVTGVAVLANKFIRQYQKNTIPDDGKEDAKG